VFGLLYSLARKDKRTGYFWLLIVTTYLFFAYVLNGGERYTIYWLPAFAFFVALPAYYLAEKGACYSIVYVAIVLLTIGVNVHRVFTQPPSSTSSYDRAAQYVVDRSRSPTVLIDAYNNGYFTYFVRQADVDRSMYVLRGDKLLTSSSINPTNKLQVHATTREDIKRIIDGFGIEYIVVEDRNYSPAPIHDELRSYLNDGPFIKEMELPVESTRTALKGLNLLVYRYLDMSPPSNNEVALHLPVVGKTIKVPFRAKQRGGNAGKVMERE
jgi:hypothetical protein